VIRRWRDALLIITIGTLICMNTAASSYEANAILTFEFSLTLPDYPSRMAWSPDNRFLAATQFNEGQVLLVDVAHQRLSDQGVIGRLHDPIMAWSPDSRYIALDGPPFLALVSVADWKEVARLRSPVDGCRFQHSRALAFTPDSQAVWISCIQRGPPVRHAAALKLRIPTLEIEDRLETDPPVMSDASIYAPEDRITSHNDSLLLLSQVSSCSADKHPNGSKCVQFLVGYDLSNKSPLFMPFAIKDETDPFRIPTSAQIAAIGNLAVASWTPPSRQPPHGPRDIRLETYDTQSGKRLAAFGGPSDVGQLAISDYTLAGNGEFVIATLSDLVTKQGGLRVWDARSGRLLQSLQTPPASFLELSPDGTHLAVIMLKEIRIFRVGG
jgi:hypothetical protein